MGRGTAAGQEAERRITSHLAIVLISVFVGADDQATVGVPVPPRRRGLVAVWGVYRQGAGDIGHMSARPFMHHAGTWDVHAIATTPSTNLFSEL